MAAKFKQVYDEMLKLHEKEFEAFQEIHDGYRQDRKKWSSKFHQEGKKLLDIIRTHESRLCASTERTRPAYSARLAERFKEEVKKQLPLLDMIGVKSSFD